MEGNAVIGADRKGLPVDGGVLGSLIDGHRRAIVADAGDVGGYLPTGRQFPRMGVGPYQQQCAETEYRRPEGAPGLAAAGVFCFGYGRPFVGVPDNLENMTHGVTLFHWKISGVLLG